jgi:isocitrate dehydrogenase kinase/phosphatase
METLDVIADPTPPTSADPGPEPGVHPDAGIASVIAQALIDGFNKHYRLFRETSMAAKSRFERGAWAEGQQAQRERIEFYDLRAQETIDRLKIEFRAESLPDAVWQKIKFEYITLLTDCRQPELAETFFNTVFCRIMQRHYFHNDFIFVRPMMSTEYIDSDRPSYRCYYPGKYGLRRSLERILQDFGLACPFGDLSRDLRSVLAVWRAWLPRPVYLEANHQIQVLSSLFYRNKAAYLVGKMINGNSAYPFVVPILRDADGCLYLDTILLEPDPLAVLFSSNRAYFMVDMEVPSAYVSFLRSMMPEKPKAELYTILGLHKQGKTLFYRDFLHHLKHSTDDFVIAPGIKGLVMIVFTLPSYPYVFKVIKDYIAPQKEVTRAKVEAQYHLVKLHDRVGRMADTLEYSDVAFPIDRFTPDLLTELRTLAPSLIEEDAEEIVVRHLYIERRMVPLNIYLDTATDDELDSAIEGYGTALKQLAAANIFAGDLLYKNFGVTRYGRVIFYDYDEIDYLSETVFRRIPPPRTPEDEMSAEPWYSVGPKDVFPEEFGAFLLTNPRVRKAFLKYHADLLEPEYWQSIQARVAAGIIEDVYPYPEPMRFKNLFPNRYTGG